MPRPETETVELGSRTLDDLEDLLLEPTKGSALSFERRQAIHARIQRQRD